jgi:hypothetical protein
VKVVPLREVKKNLMRISNIIKRVSQFVLVFIRRENFQIYILGIFFCSFINTANRYVCLRTTSPNRPTVSQGAEIQEEEPEHDIIYLGFQP